MKIQRNQIKPATPWNVTLAKLRNLEHTITAGQRAAMEARWDFGRELLNKRVDYKGQKVIPGDLMTRIKEECKLSTDEITKRILFAERYPTKKECNDAIITFPSWYQMTHKGLVEKKHEKKSKQPQHPKRTIRKLATELKEAFARHGTLTRDEVNDLEELLTLLRAILEQIDRNDQARAS